MTPGLSGQNCIAKIFKINSLCLFPLCLLRQAFKRTCISTKQTIFQWDNQNIQRKSATTALVTCFPALAIGYMFSRAWHRSHVFPRLAPITCFPALSTGYIFSCARHRLHVFPRLASVICFPALSISYMFSRV